MNVRAATGDEVAPLAATLAQAFDDDPVWRWMVAPGPKRRQRLARFFALEVAHVAIPTGTAYTTADHAGAALILPPGKWRLPFATQARHAPQFTRVFGLRLPRAFGLLTKMEAQHLREPHLYVAYVGVAPAHQGRGLGTKLMEPALNRSDAERLPAYLEASSPGSARLYRRLGFEDVAELRFAGSPPLALMRRDPA